MTEQGLLSLTGVGKSFPGCIANDNIDLDVAAGEIHALLGENGAGKKYPGQNHLWRIAPRSGKHPVERQSDADRESGAGKVTGHWNGIPALFPVRSDDHTGEHRAGPAPRRS